MTTNFTPSEEASALAHQLLSPVTAAGSYAAALLALAKANALTPEKTREGLERILRETERARRSAQAVKRLFRTEHPAFAAASAIRIARSAVETEASPVLLTTDSELSPIRCDADLITEALGNLLSNAATARLASGSEAPVTLDVQNTDLGVRFTVTNPSVDPEAALRLMDEPARSATPGGAGLGLLLVRRILAAHASELQTSIHERRLCAAFTLAAAWQASSLPCSNGKHS